MHGINNDSVNEPPLPQVEALSLTPTGNHAGWSITVPDKKKKIFISGFNLRYAVPDFSPFETS
ncbi:hypothetical protein [Endozoicomonas sp. 2B-B]